jgi:hypothetical protein
MARLSKIFFPPKIDDLKSLNLTDLMSLGQMGESVASDSHFNFPSGPGLRAAYKEWKDFSAAVRVEIMRREETLDFYIGRPTAYLNAHDVMTNADVMACRTLEEFLKVN